VLVVMVAHRDEIQPAAKAQLKPNFTVRGTLALPGGERRDLAAGGTPAVDGFRGATRIVPNRSPPFFPPIR
jgi:hypothetical protein